MNNYDSILKEKKTYKDPEPIIKNNKFTKYFFIETITIIILLIISYIAYYHIILTPENIIINQINTLKNDIETIIKPLNIPNNNNNYNIEGSISLQNQEYKYSMSRNQENHKLILNKNNEELVFYTNKQLSYIQSKNIKNNQYIQKETNSVANILYNFNKNIKSTINNTSLVKNIYIENYYPVVEINFSLTETELNQLLSTSFTNDKIDIITTIKINGLTGKLINAKYIINNKTKNTRDVIKYNNHTITITNNNGKITILTLTTKNKDFTLKITKEDTLFSVLTGNNKENSYQYTYQIIDKIYNINLLIKKEESETQYQFQSNIKLDDETIQEEAKINQTANNNITLDETTTLPIQYNKLDKTEQNNFNNYINEFLSPINEFINKYKNSIY